MIWLTQLVFDCEDPDAVMQFWGQALHYRNPMIGASSEQIAAFRQEFPQFDGRGRIDDNDLRRTPVYIQRVPEPKRQRNRVRLEIGSPDARQEENRLVSLGASRTGSRDEFVDAEGNEFSVVPRPGEDTALRSIVIDALDPERLLEFWTQATGYEADPDELRCDPPAIDRRWTGECFMVDGEPFLHICGAGAAPGPAPYDLTPGLKFCATTAPKQTKNRLHLDLNSTDVDSDRDRLTELGATVLRWDAEQVLADPEGNEFCLGGRQRSEH